MEISRETAATNPTLTEQNARYVEYMRKTSLDMIHFMNGIYVLLISQLTHTSKRTNSMLLFSAMELPTLQLNYVPEVNVIRNITCLFCIAEHPSLKLSKISFNLQHRLQKVLEILRQEHSQCINMTELQLQQPIQCKPRNSEVPNEIFFVLSEKNPTPSILQQDHTSVIGGEVTYAIPIKYERTYKILDDFRVSRLPEDLHGNRLIKTKYLIWTPLDKGEDSVRRLPRKTFSLVRKSSRALYFRRLQKSDSDLKNLHIKKRSNGFKTEKMKDLQVVFHEVRRLPASLLVHYILEDF
ncbi:hypothetical protein YC2023_010493 [Brassica napus]